MDRNAGCEIAPGLLQNDFVGAVQAPPLEALCAALPSPPNFVVSSQAAAARADLVDLTVDDLSSDFSAANSSQAVPRFFDLTEDEESLVQRLRSAGFVPGTAAWRNARQSERLRTLL